MSQDSNFNTQWVDIIGPPPPETNTVLIWSVAIIIGIIIVLAFYLIWQKRPEQLAHRKLSNLIALKNSNQRNNKALLKQLELILCQRYKVSYLTNITIRNENWSEYFHALTKACYQPDTPDDQLTLTLINQAKTFITKS